ncbi:hypothetical protein [Halobellus rufus]|uniref:hypothetical protein n=1 Tax=Halobellus rufus TaxID=1448860 RepID=UPI0012DFF308|nr:hypothetical protein [Halobellus rufus]
MLQSRSQILILTILLIVFLAVVPISYFAFGDIGLEGYSVISTSLLSLGLVLLYYEQHSVLKSQKEPLLEMSQFYLNDDLQYASSEISNFGGGPATSLRLIIELYDLSGEDPIDRVSGTLSRVEEVQDSVEKVTRSASILPNEVGIPFEIQSKEVIPMGGSSSERQRSLGRILQNEMEDRDVLYGKIIVEYDDIFDTNQYTADFSLKFTIQDGEVQYENFTYLPWKEGFPNNSLGG